MKKISILAGVLLSMHSYIANVQATTVYIDFGDTAGTEGGNWNTISAADAADVNDITGLVDWNTGLVVPWSVEMGGTWEDTTQTAWDTSTSGNWAGANTGNDGIFRKSASGFSIRIFGVDPSEIFTVELISYVKDD
jgi:hypothetical protein